MKLKKGDTVQVMSGKEKGKRGKISRVYPEDFLLVVEGVNIKKRHRKPTKSGEKGQTIEKQNPIPSSKVQLVCSKCSKAVRIGYRVEGKTKIRICKKCGAEV
ncbi:50S ribosomal protein L24 [Patescibacteria group bacterium]|nr:50S ribosomal protein L24 [Patescibacteria group bacterium]